MKFVKIIAMVLLVAMIGCSFIACMPEDNTGDKPKVEKDTTPPPVGTPSQGITEIKVSFEIKDSSGTNIYRELDYEYKGFDPTILGVLKYYFEVEINEFIATYEEEEFSNMIWIIGDHEAKPGQYWTALRGNKFTDNSGNPITVKNLIKPENEELMQSYMISSMSEHTLTNGETFTVVLVGTPEEEASTEAPE